MFRKGSERRQCDELHLISVMHVALQNVLTLTLVLAVHMLK